MQKNEKVYGICTGYTHDGHGRSQNQWLSTFRERNDGRGKKGNLIVTLKMKKSLGMQD